MELVLASSNVHKIRELREMLKSYKRLQHLDILSLLNFPDYKAPPEDGATFKENVEIKALDAAKKLGKWVIADDSGLVIPALQGAPGVYSARYAGEEATDAENRQKLLKQMQGLQDIQRTGYFECWLSLASPEGIKKTVSGTCEGLILEEEKGRNGFGYDPLFIKHDYDKTFSELDEQTKNKISHRRKALEKLLPTLEALNS
ncbi:MAG: non-canonical purine NTP pyrophosphatase, RdgB/HAM1 family [Chlamydiales bacterium 38-26]|nr:XTP/dITP diphosphatase [Chlamydiales bacterium]OJV11104.1 MAG: non-canonical purine NTP pyrophosphatase, RdgB/HAM1 family [Chlamydiales bacterium 38-26]